MSITKLSIFQKDTDVNASIRGFEYQLLNTLRDWIIEYLEEGDTEIFCEYGDDIVHSNSVAASIKFKQVKSYSNNLSFNSKEVRKTILNFFMLFASPEYLLTDISFVFETNTSAIKKDLSGNSVLSKWKQLREKGGDVTARKEVSQAIRKIVTDQLTEDAKGKILFFDEQISKISSKKHPNFEKIESIKELRKKTEDGLDYINNVPLEVFSDFAMKVDFVFHDKSPEEAITDLTANIEHLISKLPFEIEPDNVHGVLSALRWSVSQSAIQGLPKNRILTREGLRDSVLSVENHKWYVNLKHKFEHLDYSLFSFGDYLDLRSAVRHARQNVYLKDDWHFWINHLIKFIAVPQFYATPFRRNGIYELIFISFFSKTLDDQKELIIEFMGSFESFIEADDIENTVIALSLVMSFSRIEKLDIKKSVIDKWAKSLIAWVDGELGKNQIVNQKALFLDLRAEIAFQIESNFDKKKGIEDGIKYLGYLIPLLKKTTFYPIIKLSDRVTKYLHILSSGDQENLAALEDLSIKINEFHAEEEGKYGLAKIYRDRGTNFYKEGKLVKSIQYFHKAKLLYFSQEGIVGTILATLLNSGSYLNLRMQYAAKYYGYCTAFLSSTAPQLKGAEKYLPDGLALVALADYKAGNWISFFDAVDGYLGVHFQMESDDPINPKRKDNFERVLFSSLILEYVTDRLYSDFSVFVKFRIGRWKRIPVNLTAALRIEVNKLLDTKSNTELLEWLKKGISQTPFSDVGNERTIFWKCMGVQWNVKFKNDFATTSLAEEFVAMFQIFQVDLSDEDYITFKNIVNIEIEKTTGKIEFEHSLDTGKYSWKVKIPEFNGFRTVDVNTHYFDFIRLMSTIINTVGLLPPARCYEILERHLKDDLGSKTTPVKPYEILYRELCDSETFDLSQRVQFSEVTVNKIDPVEAPELKWKDDPIKDMENFKNYIKNIYSVCSIGLSVSLEDILDDKYVKTTIAELRTKGWKDWHVFLSMYELSLNFKCSRILSESASSQDFYKKRSELWGKDEKESFIKLPLSMFTVQNLETALLETMPQTMDALGLYHTSPYVNLRSIEELLARRYLFWDQDISHVNMF